jgi:replicative DNA helicase
MNNNDENKSMVPHSVEAEQATLGSVIINPESISLIAWLKPEHFYVTRNKWVWEAMLALLSRNVPVDIVTLNEELNRMDRLEEIGITYTTMLINQSPTSYNVEHYARIVVDHAQRRNDIQIANSIAQGAYGGGVDRAHIIDLLTKNSGNYAGAQLVKNLLTAFYDDIVERAKSPKDVWGISTGIAALDRATGGMQKQQTTMLAGAPGVGKTTLLLQLMLEAAKQGWRVGIYELEMDTPRLLARLISMLTGVPIRDMKSGRMENHWEHFNRGMEILEPLSLYICDNPVMDTAQLRGDVSRIKEGMRAIIPNLADMSGPAEVAFSADNVFFMVQDAESKIDFTLLPAKMRDSDTGRALIPLRKPQGKIAFGEPARL